MPHIFITWLKLMLTHFSVVGLHVAYWPIGLQSAVLQRRWEVCIYSHPISPSHRVPSRIALYLIPNHLTLSSFFWSRLVSSFAYHPTSIRMLGSLSRGWLCSHLNVFKAAVCGAMVSIVTANASMISSWWSVNVAATIVRIITLKWGCWCWEASEINVVKLLLNNNCTWHLLSILVSYVVLFNTL